MLARLDELDGVDRAEVDRAGELLRLTVDPRMLAGAIAALGELGYEADVTEEAAAATSWYDARSVGELSFVEAGAIAARVVPLFARERNLSDEQTAELLDIVVAALHRSFAGHVLGSAPASGAFRDECVRATTVAASRVLGAGAAHALGALLELDMSQDHRR